MRLAISNIAWEPEEDEAIAELLTRYGVDAIDIAPGKYFPNPALATASDIRAVKDWWGERGFEITGMQALLFGTVGLNMFGTPQSRDVMLTHLEAVCRIGGGLGARRVVFGSPKNRDRSGLSDAETAETAIAFFRRLGDIAESHGVTICLEPNPECYGANFMTTSAEAARVVAQVAHPAIRMQFDTGAVTINGEDPMQVVQSCRHLIGHIHASEPNLIPLGDHPTDHDRIAAALIATLPELPVTIEMVATKDEAHLISIERAVKAAIGHYRNGHVGTRA